MFVVKLSDFGQPDVCLLSKFTSCHLKHTALLRGCVCNDLSCLVAFFIFCSTLVIGGAGSLMLDLYGWESVFYVSGLLSVLWAYCMWKYLLKGEGKRVSLTVSTRAPYRAAAYLYNSDSVSSCVLTCLCSSVFAGPIITLESLGSGGPQSKLSKRHWLRLLKQPAVW